MKRMIAHYRWSLLVLLALLVALILPISGAFAGKPNDASSTTPTAVDAFMFFQRGNTPGTCPAPPNGGSTQVGCRFVLDLMLNAGSIAYPDSVTAQQSYPVFTYSRLQNARVSQIAAACVPTSTVTADHSTFNAILQNDVCNGPAPCTFRWGSVSPGSLAYASGDIYQCPMFCSGVFRVAQVGLCAVAAGTAILHWNVLCPGPLNCDSDRDTMIITMSGEQVENPYLFSDYVINIADGPMQTLTTAP